MTEPPHVVIVGGGSSGVGIARDLALRGVSVTLFERGPLAAETTGHMHGLLHSGARYAVADPQSARECITENRTLREIAPHCIEPTGGLFVARPEDPAAYFERKREACAACNIPVETLDGQTARRREKGLSADVQRALGVPDGVVDPFSLVAATAADAADNGAEIETGVLVTDLHTDSGRVTGVAVEQETSSGHRAASVEADHVVNATGAWAPDVAAMAGVDIEMAPTRGAMVVLEDRLVDTVVNRCRPKGDADIVVPYTDTTILGTTAVPVEDPNEFPREEWEVETLLETLRGPVPSINEADLLTSYWGVRPLFAPDDRDEEGDMTRTHTVLDHGRRDGTPGLTSVVGGKLTTYRLTAAAVADQVCERLGVTAQSRTGERPLPGRDDPARLEQARRTYGLDRTLGQEE